MSTLDEHIAKRMKQARKELGMTQIILSGLLGVTKAQICNRETAKHRTSAADLYRTAKALCVPVTYFFEGYDRE